MHGPLNIIFDQCLRTVEQQTNIVSDGKTEGGMFTSGKNDTSGGDLADRE